MAQPSLGVPAQPLPGYLRAVAGGVEIAVKVVPGASRDRIVGPLGDDLKIQVAAPPEKGRANAAVVRLLAEALGVSENKVSVVAGPTSPRKTVRVEGVSAEQAGIQLRSARS